jgi:hypothetical protein
MRPSKDSVALLNQKYLRAGRTERVGEADVGLLGWGEIEDIVIQA